MLPELSRHAFLWQPLAERGSPLLTLHDDVMSVRQRFTQPTDSSGIVADTSINPADAEIEVRNASVAVARSQSIPLAAGIDLLENIPLASDEQLGH